MPELPEVSYFKKYVDATALHQKIMKVVINDTYILKASQKELEDALQGQELTQSRRHGKYILLELTNGEVLVFHFGMTGHFEYLQHEELPKYAYFSLIFENNARLCLICPRKLARVDLAKNMEAFIKGNDLGIDALALDLDTFQELLANRRGSIKGALLNQNLIAGIGNMYADEVLFQTKIHPNTKINDLKTAEIEAIFSNIKPVLNTVIACQSEDKQLPDTYLTLHRGKNATCPNDKGSIKKIKVAGRSTYFCPECQEER